MNDVRISVDAAKRFLSVSSSADQTLEPVTSRVSWVFAFLGLLVEASRRDVALDKAML